MPRQAAKLHPKNLLELTGKDNVRLAFLARDSRTGRLIPGLKPQASLIAADGKLYGPGELPLVGHSWLYHYDGNARIPRKGLYSCACTSMRPASAAGAGRASDSRRPPMSSSKTFLR